MKKIFLSTIYLLSIIITSMAQNVIEPFERLLAELDKHEAYYHSYRNDNMPILMDNTEMGGLADPLGLGLYETWVSDLWTAPTLIIEKSENEY